MIVRKCPFTAIDRMSISVRFALSRRRLRLVGFFRGCPVRLAAIIFVDLL